MMSLSLLVGTTVSMARNMLAQRQPNHRAVIVYETLAFENKQLV